MGVILTGCAGGKAAKKDPFFEKWENAAKTSQGHSPAQEGSAVTVEGKTTDGRPAKDEVPQPNTLPANLITLNMRETDVKAVLRAMISLAGRNILFKNELKGGLSVDFNDVPWDQAFNSILRSQGLSYVWEGDIIRIVTMEDLEQDLKLASIKEKRQAQDIGARQVEPLLTAIVDIDYADAKGLEKNMQEFLTRDKDGKQRGSVKLEEHNNALIIQAIQDDLNRMLPIIRKIDRPTPQILIKANIVETTSDMARNLGIQWGGRYGTKGGGKDLTVTPGGAKGIGISGEGFGVNFPAEGMSETASGSIGVLFGTLGGNILDMQLSALQKDGKLNILSSPSITTLDNQKAFTESGEKVPFITYQAINGTLPGTPSYENAVLKLEITPHVIDGKNLKMKILVQKDEVDLSRQVAGYPLIIKKQTETSLIVSDGETIVISGLTKHRESDTVNGVPWLKDIPLFGWFFKGSSKSKTMEEVLIFITPQILPPRLAEVTK